MARPPAVARTAAAPSQCPHHLTDAGQQVAIGRDLQAETLQKRHASARPNGTPSRLMHIAAKAMARPQGIGVEHHHMPSSSAHCCILCALQRKQRQCKQCYRSPSVTHGPSRQEESRAVHHCETLCAAASPARRGSAIERRESSSTAREAQHITALCCVDDALRA